MASMGGQDLPGLWLGTLKCRQFKKPGVLPGFASCFLEVRRIAESWRTLLRTGRGTGVLTLSRFRQLLSQPNVDQCFS